MRPSHRLTPPTPRRCWTTAIAALPESQPALVRFFASRSDAELAGYERGWRRGLLLRAITRGMEQRFAEWARNGISGIAQLTIPHPDSSKTPDKILLTLANGECHAARNAAEGRPMVTLTIGLADLIRLAAGTARWPTLLAGGRLRVSGDPLLLLRLPALFIATPAAR